MIRDLIHIELNDMPIEGLGIHVIRKYVVKTAANESFLANNLSILLVKSGKFKLQLQEIIHDLSARDLLVIPRNSYCTILEVHDKLQFFLISFTSDFALKNCLKKELIDSFHFFIAKSSIQINLDEKDFLVLSLIYKLIHFVNRDAVQNGVEKELQRISFNLFLYELRLIYNKYFTEDALGFTRKESLTIQFLTILTIHCRKQHTAKFYAGSLFVTLGYLNKTVKQITGKTVKELIDDAIIMEAKNLLEDPQFTIAAIAEELEFTTVSLFSRFFKRHTSISPSQYRSNTIDDFNNK